MCCTLINVSKNNLTFLKYYFSLHLKKHANTPLTKYETRKLWVPLQTNIPVERPKQYYAVAKCEIMSKVPFDVKKK